MRPPCRKAHEFTQSASAALVQGRMPETLLLTRTDVARLLEPDALRAALHEAFIAYSLRRSVAAQRFVVPLPATAPAGRPPRTTSAATAG